MALDQCHPQVVRALEKDGWVIENEEYRLLLPSRVGYIDLRMSRGKNGHREQLMFVEVKCFPDEDSTTRDLYVSIGQYLVYRAMIDEIGLPDAIYLAVPEHIYEKVFDSAVTRVVSESKIKMIIVDIVTEAIVQWIR